MSEQTVPLKRRKSLQDTAITIVISVIAFAAACAVILHGCVWAMSAVWGRGSVGAADTRDAIKASPLNPVAGYDIEVAPPAAIYVLFVAVIGAMCWGGWQLAVMIGRRSHARKSGLTTSKDLTAMTYDNQVKIAEKIMPAQIIKTYGINTALVSLGTHNGKQLWTLVEDAYFVLAPARTGGKTSNLAIPWVLDAPGPVIFTGTKNDVAMTTIQARLRRGGTVAALDPSGILGWADELRFDPVAGCEDPDEALARGKAWGATASLAGGSTGNGKWFADKAGEILAYLLHAAAVKEGGNMRDVLKWSSNFYDDEPIELLRGSAALEGVDWADQLITNTRGGAGETISSIQMTLSGVTSSLLSPTAMRLVCPSPEERFDLVEFLSGPNTLYLLAPAELPIGPLFTLFLDTTIRQAKTLSQRREGSRLWPALRLVLDELTNLASLPDMSRLMSDAGGRGITVMAFCQTLAQLIERYGREGAAAILGNANAQLFLPGIQELDLLEEISKRTPTHDHERISTTANGGAGSSTYSTEQRQMMKPDEIRRLNPGEAMLFYRTVKAAKIQLIPWWEREDAAQLHKDITTMEAKTGMAIE